MSDSDGDDLNLAEKVLYSKKSQNRMLIILMIINFTEVLGFTIIMPVIPFLATSLGLNELQIGLIGSIFSLCQLFASPITGKLSDRYGRKPLLLISQFSTFTGFMLLGFADRVLILVLARLVDGLLGSNMTVVQASLSDISSKEDRTRIYSISSGVFGAGLILGPALGGILAKFDYSIPMFVGAGVSLLSIILVIFILPETYKDTANEFKLKFNDIVPVKETIRYSKDPIILRRLLMNFNYNFAFMLFITNFTLMLINKYNISIDFAGYYRTWIGFLRVILQLFFVSMIIKKLGEKRVLFTGVFAMFVSMVGFIFTPHYLLVFIPVSFLAYGTGVARPILTSMLANSVDETEYATILGINSSLRSLGQIVTPIIGGAILLYLNPTWLLSTVSFLFAILLLLITCSFDKKSGLKCFLEKDKPENVVEKESSTTKIA